MRLHAAALVAAYLIFVISALPVRAAPLLWGGAIGRLRMGPTLKNQCTYWLAGRRKPHDPEGYRRIAGWDYVLVSAGHCHRARMRAFAGDDAYDVVPQGYAPGLWGADILVGSFRSGREYRTLSIDFTLPLPGRRVQAVGFPVDAYRAVVAPVLAVRGEPHQAVIAFDAAVSGGFSGGPLLDVASGQVLGTVIQMTLVGTRNIYSDPPSFAQAAAALRPLLPEDMEGNP